MGIFENREDERFDFEVELQPKRAGDFGAISIGGCYRSPESCIEVFNDLEEQINRHVDGVENLHMKIVDVYGEYEDIYPWQYEDVRRKFAKENNISIYRVKFEDIKDKFPKKTYDETELLNNYNWVRKSLIEGTHTVEEIIEQMNIDVPCKETEQQKQ